MPKKTEEAPATVGSAQSDLQRIVAIRNLSRPGVPVELLDHLVAHGFDVDKAGEAVAAFTDHGYWRSPHGPAFGEVQG